MRLFIIIVFLLFVCDIYTQTTTTVAPTASIAETATASINYKKADSIALNFQRNKYYFYSETAQELAETFTTEREKCRAIFRWVANNIKYDYEVMNDFKKDRVDPLVVYKSKKAVCAGYASLFQAMCEEAKIKCLYITGEAKPSGIRHAWNMVKLDGSWYVMDVTWAAGHVSGLFSGSKFTKSFDEEWWMADYTKAIKTHESEDSNWRYYILGEKEEH